LPPSKKSGFILLKGKALFQLGLWKKRSEVHSSPSKRMIARGLFHSIKSLSKEGLLALEFETPVNKKDLVRFKDNYGRSNKAYEGKKFTQSINSNYIKFKTPTFKNKQIYKFSNVKLVLEVHKNFTNLLKNKSNTIFAIINGAISDNSGRNVLSYGDIVRTNDLKVLSKVFKIKKQLSVAKVTRA
tara:strand:+ start:29 stop:583 length:555 start_codon:yes stop_codon:yes gene_type:complete